MDYYLALHLTMCRQQAAYIHADGNAKHTDRQRARIPIMPIDHHASIVCACACVCRGVQKKKLTLV